MAYKVNEKSVPVEDLFDSRVFDFVSELYKGELGEPLDAFLQILSDPRAMPYQNQSNKKIIRDEESGQIREITLPYDKELQYAIGANKLFDAMEKVKKGLNDKKEKSTSAHMKKAYEHQILALDEMVGEYINKAKIVGEFYAKQYKVRLEYLKRSVEKELDEVKKQRINPIEDRIKEANKVLSSLDP